MGNGFYNDKQHQSAISRNTKRAGGGTNAAFDSEVQKRLPSNWPKTGDRDTNESTVDVTNAKTRRNKATVK